MNSKKAIVFGAAGQLGVELVRAFEARGYTVLALERARLDITSASQVDQAVAQFRPSVALNAAAYNLVDVAEQDPVLAFQVNALAVRNLALACRAHNAKLVHYSTDYVFDGRKGSPYSESDSPHPLGAYAVSKLAGEHYALAYQDDALVIRTCGVFGPGGRQTARGNFVETMLRLAASGKPVRVIESYVASPTFAPAMADRTVELVDREACGILHLGGGEPISWFDYAASVFRIAGLNPVLEPVPESEHKTPARRPKFSALSNARAESLGMTPMPPLASAVETYLRATGVLKTG